ncbi:MAG TPA: DUF2142 domain-containing protein [Acidimicrobiales bacterium]|nr:DUF2142 domain-containing protein [Acidimicrobiales bacterium]
MSGFAVLFAAWVIANPIGGAADEPSHYVKALGAAHGQWSGDVVVRPAPHMTPHDQFMAVVTRSFRIPARFALQGGHPNAPLSCIIDNQVSAACQRLPLASWALDPVIPAPGAWNNRPVLTAPNAGGPQASYVGAYHPFMYVPIGAAARIAGTAGRGLLAARATGALICLALLAGALRLTRSRGTLLGILLGATPTAVFLASAVTTNSMEIFASLCFLSAGLALVSGSWRLETWVWFALAGSVLALAKATGPAWLGFNAAVIMALLGLRGAVVLVREQRRCLVAAVGVVSASALLSLWWTVTNVSGVASSLAIQNPDFGGVARWLPAILDGSIGLFGWCDTPLPDGLYLLGRGLLGSVALAALLIGSWKHRLLLVGATVVHAGFTIALVTSNPGVCVDGQARYTLAIGLVVPMLCGHVFAERGHRIPSRIRLALWSAAVTGMASLQFGAWYVNSHRYAVGGTGPWNFLASPDWSPPGGWWPWLACAGVGSVFILGGAMFWPRSFEHGSTAPVLRPERLPAPMGAGQP